MAVNNMQVTDVYAILNSLHTQATGRQALAPTNTGEFVSMATTTLGVGTDVVYNALMNTIAKTVFSSRPYNMKFKGLLADNVRWGGIVRKISMADKPALEDKAFHGLQDGQAVDHYIINKADVLEMRFYGSDVYQDSITVFREQLVNAFQSPEQLGSFIAMQTQEMDNKWTQYMEELSRGALTNFIGAKVSTDNASVIHLISEYNKQTGLSLTKETIWQPANVKPFFEWVKGYIDTLSRRMTERSGLYQVQVQGKNVNRHTPYDKQKVYLSSQYLDIMNTTVLSEAFHNEELDYRDVESVGYWQSIQSPTSINVTPSIVNANGVVSIGNAVEVKDIFGVIFDEDAIVTNVIDNIIMNTPMNARGLYYNTWLTAHTRYTNDLTEKGIVLLLDVE